MNELAIIYDFEGDLDKAFAQALDIYTSQELNLKTFPLQTTESLPENRIEVSVIIQGSTGPQGMTQQFGQSANAYTGRVEINIVTRRQDFPNPGRARALVRAALDPRNSVDAQIASSLEYIDLVEITPTDCMRGVHEDADKKQDLSMLSYAIKFSLKPGAFP